MRFNQLRDVILRDVTDNIVTPIVAKKAAEIEGLAKLYCPVDMGYLRASITHNLNIEGNMIKAYVGTPVSYASFVNYGTGIYASDGNGRKDPWSYFNERTQQWVTTLGQQPNLFMYRAHETARRSGL